MFHLLGIEGAFFNIIKSMYDTLTANIILNDKRLKVFPPKVSALLFNKVLEVPARAIRQKIKDIQIRKEVVKLFLLAVDMILYTENPRLCQKSIRTDKKKLSKNFNTKSTYKNQLCFYTPQQYIWKINKENIPIHNSFKNTKLLWNKCNQKVKDLHTENSKTLIKEIEENINYWENNQRKHSKKVPWHWLFIGNI